MPLRRKPEPAEAELLSALESILLAAAEPVSVRALGRMLEIPVQRAEALLAKLAVSLQGGIRVQLHSGHAQLVTAPENADVVQRFLGTEKPAPLSRAALETLTVVAYRQPVTRSEIEAIRGVNADRAVQTLLARGLIEESGRRDSPGRPAEYITTFGFLEYFGLSSLNDLPSLPDSEQPVAEPGEFGLRTANPNPSQPSSQKLRAKS